MREDKTEIILEEGTSVEQISLTGDVLASSTALIGKATKQGYPEVSLESHRVAQFLYDFVIGGGDIIRATAINQDYLVLTVFKEIIQDAVVANIARMLECNGTIKVTGLTKIADENGDITTAEVVKVDNISAFVENVRAGLKMTDVGFHPNVDFIVYMPYTSVSTLDKVALTVNGITSNYKVIGQDVTSFEGVVILNIGSETRR